jgi:Family of unknown function (DUF6603)
MADDAGQVLLRLLRRQAFALLDEGRQALDQAGDLAPLGPAGPEWSGTALEPHLLAPPAGVGQGGPVATRVLEFLQARAAPAQAGLFGWDPDPAAHAQPRGIAWAVRADAGGVKLAAAVAVTAPGGTPRLDVVASGAADQASAAIELGPGWTISLQAKTAGAMTVSLGPEGDPTVTAGSENDRVLVSLSRAAPPPQGGPGIDLGGLTFTAELEIGPGSKPVADGRLQIRGGAIRLAPGAFSSLIPGMGPIPLDVDLKAQPGRGVTLAGSPALSVRLPVGTSLPGLTLGPLDLGLQPGTGPGGLTVKVDVATGLAVDLPAVPIHLALEGLGIELPFSLGDGDSLGFDTDQLVPAEPTGAGVDVTLPVVSAAGLLRRRGNQYAGLLAAEVPPLSATAFGVLELEPQLSFAVVLAATFPPPGIQIGFGFAVGGVGGIVAVNRRVDRDALMRAVTDGTAAELLFPTDPGAQGDRVIDALPAIFPAAPGHVVVGPMFQITWGGRLLSASAALLVELPDARLSLLGKVVLSVPDPALPLIKLQATFFGGVDPAEPSLFFLASLAGSSIVGMPLTGDIFLLIRGGDDPQFVLSAGGFHPRFVAPAGVPPLNRLGMDLSPLPVIDLRCQAYLALTSNTVQFGARVDLVAEVAGCGLRGYLGFDALIQFSPFRFIADASGGIELRVFGETLAGVHLALTLEGPAPWRARGSGELELFFFSASFDFDVTWGAPPPAPLATPDIAGQLTAALAERETWVLRPPDPAASPVVLTAAAAQALTESRMLHPHGSLTARQRVVPLAISIDRFNGIPVERQRWDVGDAVLGEGRPLPAAAEAREEFAPGQFLSLDDDAALGRPAFERFRAGLEFVAGGVAASDARGTDLDYETKVIQDEDTTTRVKLGVVEALRDAITVAAAGSIDHPLWWQSPDERVTVAGARAPVVADAWSLRPAVDAPAQASATEVHEMAAAVLAEDPRRRLAVVEAWEVTP